MSTFPSAVVVGGPHDGKVIAIASERMILRTSSGAYMRHPRLPEYLFHVPTFAPSALTSDRTDHALTR